MELKKPVKRPSRRGPSASFGFIIGTGRCGTTLLAQMLNSNSQVCVPAEIQILFEYCNNGARLFEIFNDGTNLRYGPEEFITLLEVRCPHNLHEYFDYRAFFERQRYPIQDLKKLIRDFYQAMAEDRQKSLFLEQTPWYGQRLDIVNDLFPDARYIHMVRDARDVAISFARTPWWHKDIGLNLQRWHSEVHQILQSSQKLLNAEQVLTIRYEDLVEDPESELRRVCEHLQIDFEEGMLDPNSFVDYASYSRGRSPEMFSRSQKEWEEKKNAPVFKESCYAWKRSSDYDFSAISEEVKQSLKVFGYEE